MGKRIPDETKKAILADLKAGKGCDEIAVNHGVGRQTVFTLREKHRDELPEWKRRTAKRLMDATGKLVDRINQGIESKDASLKDECISFGILIDKASQLTDQPSQIVEHRHEIGQGMAGWLGKSSEQTEQKPANAQIIDINHGLDNRETGPEKPGKRA
tara:strand:+ start:2112 stop:2585 length:474 start_codon:yes stop_codon:yes gene_type:complete